MGIDTHGPEVVLVRGRVWLRDNLEQHRRELAAIRAAEAAARASDVDAFLARAEEIDTALDGWGRLMRRLARLPRPPSADFRAMFLDLMTRSGDHIRQGAGDRAVIEALRAIFPPYRGPGLRLYRGESAWNRRRRAYGIAWTLDREVAESFAQGPYQSFRGGSVLLETDAPPAAVIRVVRGGTHAGEREVWVDRRHLAEVRVLKRYPQRAL